MSIDAGPPAQPPQLSPDGQWVWDGSQWQPVASGAEPVHRGVFAAWSSIQVEPANQVAEAVQQPAVQYEPQYQVPAPAVDYSYGAPEPDVTPLWQQRRGGGYGRYLYFAAALMLFVIVLIVLNSMNFVQLPFISTGSNTTPQAAPSPTPDATGPDSARADRTLDGSLKPALAALDQTLPALNQSCTGIASTACFDAVTAADQQAKRLMTVIANSDIPSCIRVPMTKMRADAKGMDDQLQAALQGFPSNNKAAVSSGVNGFRSYRQAATADFNAAVLAAKKCYTVVLPTWVPD